MNPNLSHPYGFRTWVRQFLPFWALRIGVAQKGRDCGVSGAAHHWYNNDEQTSACYYCRAIGAGELWKAELL